MKKNIVLIQSHCDDDYTKKILLDNITTLKEYNVDILLFSHIPLPEYIITEVDYFIFDKSNPILFEERGHIYWWSDGKIKIETTVPDYSWTVFNQIIKSKNLIVDLEYEYVFLICYDTLIDDTVKSYLLNPKNAIFKHKKNDDTMFDTSLIFSVFKKNDFINVCNTFSKKEYISRTDLIAEAYFEYKLKDKNLYNNTGLFTYDIISQSKDIFNQSKNEDYELFVNNVDLLKFRIINKTNKLITVIINSEIQNIETNNFIYDKKINKLETFGCFIEGVYDNWLETINEKRINKITIINEFN